MRRVLAAFLVLGLSGQSAQAEMGRRSLHCDTVTAAPGCVAASALWGFVPTGGIVIMGDRLRLAGIEEWPEGNRAVILDLGLPDGKILSVAPLAGTVPLSAVTEFSTDGSVLLVAIVPDWESGGDTDALPPQTLLAFDAQGKSLGQAEGVDVAAIADAFGENRLTITADRVTLDLSGYNGGTSVRVDLVPGEVDTSNSGPDGEWLYEYAFERSHGWYHKGAAYLAHYNRDGSPSSVTVQTAANRDPVSPDPVALIGPASSGPGDLYDREYAQPVVSPDGTRLAVLQMNDAAPGPILLGLSLPDGAVIWRAVVTAYHDRQTLYRWSPEGRLVTLQPQSALEDISVLTVFQPTN